VTDEQAVARDGLQPREKGIVLKADMSTTADTDQLPADTRCFRLRRYYLVVGIVSAVLWAAMGITFTVATLWNIDGSSGRPIRDALVLGIIWSGFVLVGVWMIAAHFRNRLFFGKSAIVQRGIFRSRTLLVGEVLQIKWRTRPVGGSIVIRTHSERATIEFGPFTGDERDELIRFVRESFAVEIQENWSRFQDVLGRSSPRGRRASRGGIMAIAAVLMCFAGVFVCCWFAGLGGSYLFIGVLNAVAAIWCLRRIRLTKDRELMEQSDSQG
jgi:hypothetical protein